MVAVNNLVRASTRGQTTKFQKKVYHAGKKTINLIGSAYKPGKNPVFKFIKSKLRNDKTVIIDLATADRFSRNTQECKDLKKFITRKNKKLIVIANRERFDFVKDFDKFIELIKDPEAQSRAISEKSKKMWAEKKKNPKPKLDIILTDVEKYFVRQIIFTLGEGNYIPVSILYEILKSCGIAKFSEKNIRKWRRDLDPIEEEEEVYSFKCAETNLRFAHPSGEFNVYDNTPLWEKYKRFIPFPEFASSLAKNYPCLNAVWEPEIGLDSMQDIDHALDEVVEDEVVEDEVVEDEVVEDEVVEDEVVEDEVVEDAAPAPDILAKIKEAHDMLKEGVLTKQEFITFKSKFI